MENLTVKVKTWGAQYAPFQAAVGNWVDNTVIPDGARIAQFHIISSMDYSLPSLYIKYVKKLGNEKPRWLRHHRHYVRR